MEIENIENIENLTREQLLALWRELNEQLGECDPEDYDDIFDRRSAVEDALGWPS